MRRNKRVTGSKAMQRRNVFVAATLDVFRWNCWKGEAQQCCFATEHGGREDQAVNRLREVAKE